MEWFVLYLWVAFIFVIQIILFWYLIADKRRIDRNEERIDYFAYEIKNLLKISSILKFLSEELKKFKNKGGK